MKNEKEIMGEFKRGLDQCLPDEQKGTIHCGKTKKGDFYLFCNSKEMLTALAHYLELQIIESETGEFRTGTFTLDQVQACHPWLEANADELKKRIAAYYLQLIVQQKSFLEFITALKDCLPEELHANLIVIKEPGHVILKTNASLLCDLLQKFLGLDTSEICGEYQTGCLDFNELLTLTSRLKNHGERISAEMNDYMNIAVLMGIMQSVLLPEHRAQIQFYYNYETDHSLVLKAKDSRFLEIFHLDSQKGTDGWFVSYRFDPAGIHDLIRYVQARIPGILEKFPRGFAPYVLLSPLQANGLYRRRLEKQRPRTRSAPGSSI